MDIAVVRLPPDFQLHRFQPLACLEQVSLRYVDCVASLGQPHVIILPGTKNTMEDLKWLRGAAWRPFAATPAGAALGYGHLRRIPDAGEPPV